MSARVSIVGLDKVLLIELLWQNAGPLTLPSGKTLPSPPYDPKEALRSVASGNLYVDYCYGRSIKCNLASDSVDPSGYDADYGSGAFARVAASMRA